MALIPCYLILPLMSLVTINSTQTLVVPVNQYLIGLVVVIHTFLFMNQTMKNSCVCRGCYYAVLAQG